MSETPFFFARGEAQLFGVLHSPVGLVTRSGFVLSHPFGEEKLWSHRVFVSLARTLARRGHAVLRFDYTGSGDSSGSTLDVSLETHLADLTAAIGALAGREPSLERVGLIGLRLGATFSALVMERAAETAFPRSLAAGPLVLWDPVLNGTDYLQELMRSNLAMQLAAFGKVVETREALRQRILDGGTINVDGYEIGRTFFESCDRADLLPVSAKGHPGPTLIVPVAPATRHKPRPDLQALASSYPFSELIRADEQPFWREIKQFYGRAEVLESLTVEWHERINV
jgi:alpha/beta superfamily hydrolase